MSIHYDAMIHCLRREVSALQHEERKHADALRARLSSVIDPDDCCLEIKLGLQPEINWQHSAANHFDRGGHPITIKGFCKVPQVEWKDWYFDQVRHVYHLLVRTTHHDAASHPRPFKESNKHKIIGIQNLPHRTAYLCAPLRTRNGNVYWYRHKIYPCSLDTNGRVTALMNEFRRFARYEDYLPGPPRILCNRVVDQVNSPILSTRYQSATLNFLKTFLSPALVKWMQSYRALIVSTGEPLSHTEIITGLNSNKEHYHKTRQRIRNRLSDHLQGFIAETELDLARWLNNL